MKEKLIPAKILLIMLAVIIFLSACDSITYEKEERVRISDQYYLFDQNTVIGSLEAGNTNVFIPQLVTPDATQNGLIKPVNWQQLDFIEIAEAVFNFEWGDLADGWKLRVMSYSLDCSKVKNGPQSAFFMYFKVISDDTIKSRIERYITIDPAKQGITTAETRITPARPGNKSIEVRELKLTADDILQIAEDNGGFEARSAIQNDCQINFVLSPNAIYPGWSVDYSNSSDPYIISFEIDPQTGKIKVLK